MRLIGLQLGCEGIPPVLPVQLQRSLILSAFRPGVQADHYVEVVVDDPQLSKAARQTGQQLVEGSAAVGCFAEVRPQPQQYALQLAGVHFIRLGGFLQDGADQLIQLRLILALIAGLHRLSLAVLLLGSGPNTLAADALPIEVTDEEISFPWFTLTGIDGERVFAFDPYQQEDEGEAKRFFPAEDHPERYNRILPQSVLERTDISSYSFGPVEEREAVLLFNGRTVLTEETTVEYMI